MENLQDKPLELKENHSITVEILATFKIMHICCQEKYFNTDVDDHYKTQEKQDRDDETDWEECINVWKSFKKYKKQLLKHLEKFRCMCDWHLGTIRSTDHQIQLTDEEKPSFQKLYRTKPMKCKQEQQEVKKLLRHDFRELSASEWAAPIMYPP